MNIVYLGTPDFATFPLEKIIGEGKHKVVAVVTNPDKPVGRKRVLTPPPVKVVAEKYGIPVYQYDKIRVQGVDDLIKLKPDIMITCAFGQILSQEILDISVFGVINIHASLLPKYRGASPIHYAILNGEKTTGITIMKTDIGIDTGDMILQRELEVLEGETCGELFSRLSVLGADCILETLDLIENGKVQLKKQDDSIATYTKIFKKEDALIDWADSAENIYNKIRAFNPSPVAFTLLNGEPFKIYSAKPVNASGEAGEILKVDGELIVGCGSGVLSLTKVQKCGGNALDIKDFLRGSRLKVGDRFGK